MLSYIRRTANEVCRAADDDFTPTFGIDPVTQAFGDVAAEGTATAQARADHRHGMPDQQSFVLDLETNTMFLHELVLAGITNTAFKSSPGAPTFGGRDDPGNIGAYGSVEMTTSGALATAGTGFWVAQNITGASDTTRQDHVFKRTRVLAQRIRPALFGTGHATPQLVSCRVAVGAIRTATNVLLDTVNDGVYFRADIDAAGAGNWFAFATNAGSSTSVDTGVAPHLNTDATVAFQIFKITFDGTAAKFFITTIDENDVVINDGETALATISTNIPADTNKIAAFGGILQNQTALARTIVFDNILISGLRNYSS